MTVLPSIAQPEPAADLAAYPYRVRLTLDTGEILIKGPRGLLPAALRTARDKARQILADVDPDVVERLGAYQFQILVVPRGQRISDQPGLKMLARQSNPFGQPVDRVRGVFLDHPGLLAWGPPRPTDNPPLLVIGEEDVLRIAPSGPHSTFHHEFAHAIHRLGLSEEQRSRWHDLFEAARRHGLFGKRYATVDDAEFFAELSSAYFDVAPYFCTKSQLAKVDRPAFLMLAEIYSHRRLNQRLG